MDLLGDCWLDDRWPRLLGLWLPSRAPKFWSSSLQRESQHGRRVPLDLLDSDACWMS